MLEVSASEKGATMLLMFAAATGFFSYFGVGQYLLYRKFDKR